MVQSSSKRLVTENIGLRADVVAPAPTGTAATDQANLQAAIDACPAGGLLYLRDGVYKTNAALSITKHLSITGQSLVENWRPRSIDGLLNRPNEPFVTGAVIEQQTAATNVFDVTGSAVSLKLRNLGITWASAIRHTNTGHGINAAPSVVPGAGGHDSGLMGWKFDNVVVGGHDGNHYALYALNEMYGKITGFRSYGGGALHVECDSFLGNYGNLHVDDFYAEVFNAGTADGIRLTGRVQSTAAAGVLNLLTFIRPQVNITGAAATAGTQKFFNAHGNASVVPNGVDLFDPDFEGAGANPCDFGGVNSGVMVRNGGTLDPSPTGGYDRGPGANYQKFTSSGTFRVPDGVYQLRTRCTGGGGGGAGAGSALTSGGVANQVGGGGGGVGHTVDIMVPVTPRQTYTVTIGAAGTGGSGGALNSNAGTAGGNGGRSSFQSLCRADGGGGGQASAANSNAAVGGGIFGRGGTSTTQNVPGCGGVAQSPNGLTAVPIPPNGVGGGGGGAANTTNGGGGGSAITTGADAYTAQGGGSQGASGTAAGVAGTTCTTPGSGGGGGGGGAPGGAGGNGGAGAPGLVEVWW